MHAARDSSDGARGPGRRPVPRGASVAEESFGYKRRLMQPLSHLLWLGALMLLVLRPAGIEARGKKTRARTKRRPGTAASAPLATSSLILHREPQLEYRSQFLSVAECQELLRLTDTAGSQWNQGAIRGTLCGCVAGTRCYLHLSWIMHC